MIQRIEKEKERHLEAIGSRWDYGTISYNSIISTLYAGYSRGFLALFIHLMPGVKHLYTPPCLEKHQFLL